MSFLLALTAPGPALADNFNRSMQPRPVEDLLFGLVGLGLAVIVIRIVMRLRKQLPATEPGDSDLEASDPEITLAIKFAQWRSSMLILVTATAICMLVRWFDFLNSSDYGSNLFALAGAMSGSRTFYLAAFVPVFVWHLADLIERPRAKPVLLTAFTSHALLTGLLICTALAWVLSMFGLFTVERPCGGSFIFLMESCIGLVPALGMPLKLLILSVLLIGPLKLAVAMWSRLGPRP